jgi:hypothetical protein
VPTFTPPTVPQGSTDPFFGRYSVPVGVSVVKRAGVFERRPYPALAEIAGLTEGVDWFQGGRTYVIDSATATALTADGFTVTADAGYGVAPYGAQGFGI